MGRPGPVYTHNPALSVQAPARASLLRARSHFTPKHYVLHRAAAGSSYTLAQKLGRNKAVTQAQPHGHRDGVQDLK